jgi:SAM-dependent methyltransferase
MQRRSDAACGWREFDAVGKLEYYLLRSLGLRSGHLVIDVGCGSGRLARQLASDTSIRYVGTDVVPRLLEAARTAAGRNDWEFRLLKVSGSRVRTMWPISSRSSLFSPTSPTRRVFNISRRIKWENRTVMKSLGNLGQSVAVLRKV